MNKMQWTPGPWRMIQPIALDYRAPLVYGPNAETLIATAEGGGPRRAIDAPETRANAFLIAAAPALYEALNSAVHALRSYQHGNSATELAKEVADHCEAAIAKARGEATAPDTAGE